MPLREPGVVTPKAMPLLTRSAEVGRVAAPAGRRGLAEIQIEGIGRMVGHDPDVVPLAACQTGLENRRTVRCGEIKSRAVVHQLESGRDESSDPRPSRVVKGLVVVSEIKPMWARMLPPVVIMNRKNPIPVSPSSIGLVMPLNPMARTSVPELWPMTDRVVLPSWVGRPALPVASPSVSKVPPSTPLHAWPSGLPVIPSKFATSFSSAWAVVLTSSTARTPATFLDRSFHHPTLQNRCKSPLPSDSEERGPSLRGTSPAQYDLCDPSQVSSYPKAVIHSSYWPAADRP